jgi:4-hydroxybenzoate polyprenyltransferase
MTQPTIDMQTPVWRRFMAYLRERFPLPSHGLLIVSYCSSNQFLSQVLDAPDRPVAYSLRSLLGAMTILCLFFHLRVFDEPKDYEEDGKHHPDRILQRGLVTLRHLKIAGSIAIAIELGVGCSLGKSALVSILAALAFSFLMLKEFFIGAWLRRHFLLYATSHMLIMPLFAMVVYSITTGRFMTEAPALFWLYAFVGFFVTFNWEVSRKIRAPEDEIEGVDTYTQVLGTYAAAYVVLLIRVIDTAMVAFVGWKLGLGMGFNVVLLLLFLVCMTGFMQFRLHTNSKTAKRMETYAGMYIVAFDLTLAFSIAQVYGMKGIT